MADPIHRDTLADMFADIDRRLAALERGPRMPYTSISAPDGTVLARFGDLGDGTTGTRIGKNPAGNAADTWLDVRKDEGLRYPQIEHAWQRSGDFYSVTADSPTWVTAWTARVGNISAAHVKTTLVVVCSAGTTGQVRIRTNQQTTVVAGPVTLNSGGVATQTTIQVFWDVRNASVGRAPGWAWEFYVEATRTSGTGEVRVYQPYPLDVGYWSNATTTGGLIIT